ncbi:MAG TPA: DUF1028 domain-containing protein [Acidimicrobiia bacterium]|nr:DUF1028 domain-containing protein [Acidimicrobiia bacterium]
MTYSVIAYDPESGAYGVAVQSHWFNVGRTAPWVRFGVGAVVTQALTDPSYGWRGLDAMSDGVPAGDALERLLADDSERDRRQVAFVDSDGRVAVHTGSRCIAHAGHVVGEGWAVLGNLLASERVVEAMAEVFPRSKGTLAERMVSTLEVAQENGGDLRGVQSAAIRVAPGQEELEEGFEAGIDFSVPDHPDPIAELRRLVTVDRSYRALRRAQTALSEGKEALALHHLSLAERLPHGVELDFWRALALFELGKAEAAAQTMAAVLDEAPQFEEVLRRLAAVDATARELRDSRLV